MNCTLFFSKWLTIYNSIYMCFFVMLYWYTRLWFHFWKQYIFFKWWTEKIDYTFVVGVQSGYLYIFVKCCARKLFVVVSHVFFIEFKMSITNCAHMLIVFYLLKCNRIRIRLQLRVSVSHRYRPNWHWVGIREWYRLSHQVQECPWENAQILPQHWA